MLAQLRELLRFKIDESNFAIRVEQINSRLRLYPRIVFSQVAIAFLLVGVMWNGVSHSILLGWLALICSVHLVEILFWVRLHNQANTIEQCRRWNILFCWFSAIVGLAWGISSFFMFPHSQMLYQVILICVVLGITGAAVSSNPVHPPSLLIHMIGIVVPLIICNFWEGDRPHLYLGGMLVIYILYIISAATELINTFEKSVRQRIENEILLHQVTLHQTEFEKASAEITDLYNRAPLGYHSLNKEGVFCRINDTELSWLGYTRDELLGKLNWRDVLTPASQQVFRQSFPLFKQRGYVDDLEMEIVRKDGTKFIVLVTGTAIYDDGGNFFLSRSMLTDITNRKMTEQKLAESMIQLEAKELAKSHFLAAAGHDLRQPLSAANLFIDALKGIGISNEQKQIVDRLDQAMSNFNVLLDTLLNVSKLDAGIIKPEITSVNLAEIFVWLEQTFAQLLKEKHLRFKLFLPLNKPLIVRTDYGLLKSVLMNLVSNALKFTSKGGIFVSARPRGDEVLFQVWDTGIGIQEENIEKIFDDFFQINNPQRDRTQGLGLGLSIAKRSLALFDGKISCRSQFGRGSVFAFRLPTHNKANQELHDSRKSEPMELEAVRQFVKGKRFVIVEDDAMVSEALKKSLTVMEGRVESYYDADVALQTANIENADCYIVDYMLPGDVDGTNFLLRLHQELHRPVCAVMMSGNTTSDFIRKAAFFDWPVLHKPVNTTQLVSRLSEQYNKPD